MVFRSTGYATERLPEPASIELVLAWDGEFWMQLAWLGDRWRDELQDPMVDFSTDQITHWLPLPPAPTEGAPNG